MPLINLIKEQRLASHQREKKVRVAFYGVAAVCAVSLLAATFCMVEAGVLNGRAGSLERDVKKLEPSVKQVQDSQKQYDQLAPRLTTLMDAQKGTQRWLQILSHLKQNMPTGLWLTHIKCTNTDKTKPVSASFSGTSSNQDLVGGFMLRLEACDALAEVKLKQTQERITEAGKGIDFEVTADIVGTEEVVKKAKDDKDKGKESS